MLKRQIGRFLENKLPFVENLASVIIGRKYPIFLDYKVDPIPRYGYGNSPHNKLYEIIDNNRDIYFNYLTQFLQYKEYFTKIPLAAKNPLDPQWISSYLPGLDGVAFRIFDKVC